MWNYFRAQKWHFFWKMEFSADYCANFHFRLEFLVGFSARKFKSYIHSQYCKIRQFRFIFKHWVLKEKKVTGYKLYVVWFLWTKTVTFAAAVLATQTTFRFLWVKWPSKTSCRLPEKWLAFFWPSVPHNRFPNSFYSYSTYTN